VVLKATKVDGVYDKDPTQFADAQKMDTMDYERAVTDGAIKVMDNAAMGMAMEHKLPIIIFDALKPGNIVQAAEGKAVGTKIS